MQIFTNIYLPSDRADLANATAKVTVKVESPAVYTHSILHIVNQRIKVELLQSLARAIHIKSSVLLYLSLLLFCCKPSSPPDYSPLVSVDVA